MEDEMVMRSIYLRLSDDGRLRQIAHEMHLTKSDLIRTAVALKLAEWEGAGGQDAIRRDLAAANGGGRDQGYGRIEPMPSRSGTRRQAVAAG